MVFNCFEIENFPVHLHTPPWTFLSFGKNKSTENRPDCCKISRGTRFVSGASPLYVHYIRLLWMFRILSVAFRPNLTWQNRSELYVWVSLRPRQVRIQLDGCIIHTGRSMRLMEFCLFFELGTSYDPKWKNSNFLSDSYYLKSSHIVKKSWAK